MLFDRDKLAKASEDALIRYLQKRGHGGVRVGDWTIHTPGGAARIHALAHSWAQWGPPSPRWTLRDIQVLHELAVRRMLQEGFYHDSPIEPELQELAKRGIPARVSPDQLVAHVLVRDVRIRMDPKEGPLFEVPWQGKTLVVKPTRPQWHKVKWGRPDDGIMIFRSQVLGVRR
ncbi:MAG: hypothetical protein QXY39_04225 [Thermofilaceae archaeon]